MEDYPKMSNIKVEHSFLFFAFQRSNITVEGFVQILLTTPEYCNDPLTISLAKNVPEILGTFRTANPTRAASEKWVCATSTDIYQEQMAKLTRKETGFHFLAKKMTEERLTAFDVDDLALRMQSAAPDLWHLTKTLLSANIDLNKRRSERQKDSVTKAAIQKREDGDIEMGDLSRDWWLWSDADWEDFASKETPLFEADEDPPEDMLEHEERKDGALIVIVSIKKLKVDIKLTHSSETSPMFECYDA